MDETGEWDLEGLFIRLGAAIDQVRAKRVVLDTLENLFGSFSDTATLRVRVATVVRLAEGTRRDGGRDG